jgi:outer membrane protein assembly factor BamB
MPRNRRLSLIIIATLALLVAVLFHYLPAIVNAGHSVRQAHFRTVWTYRSQKQILTPPILIHSALIFGTYDGSLEAVSAADGHSLWFLKFPDTVFSLAPGGGAGVVYAGTGLHDSQTGLLNAVNAVTGRIIWQREFKGHLEEPPAVDEAHHRLWVGTGPGSLWSLDTRDGAILWHQDLGHLDSTPLLHRDTLYVPAQKSETLHESFFYALNAGDGKILWKIDQPGQPWASPTLDKTGRIILTTTADGQIGVPRPTDKGWAYGVSLDGNTLWQSILPDMPLTPQNYVPDLDIAVYATKKGHLTALDVRTGAKRWETRAGKTFSQPAALVNYFKEPLIAVTSDDGVFSLIDARTGDILFTSKIAANASSSPLVDKGIIYITTSFGITAISDMPVPKEKQ